MKDKKIVYVPMAADIIHPGHLNIINISASLGYVIVGLFTDEAISTYKRTPSMDYETRKTVLLGLKGVDEVIPQTSRDYGPNLRNLKPDYLVHGTDWKQGPLSKVRQEAIDLMREWGGEVVEPEYTQGVSSSALKQKKYSLGFSPEEKRKIFSDQLYLKEQLLGALVCDGGSVRLFGEVNVKPENEPLREFSFLWADYKELSKIYGNLFHPILDGSEYLYFLEKWNNMTSKPMIADDCSQDSLATFIYLLTEFQKKGICGIVVDTENMEMLEKKLEVFSKHRTEDSFKLILHITSGIEEDIRQIITRYQNIFSAVVVDANSKDWMEENTPVFHIVDNMESKEGQHGRMVYRSDLRKKNEHYLENVLLMG